MSISARPPEWTENTWLAWCAILNLTPKELVALKQRLIETFGPGDDPEVGGAGVREPRRPRPPIGDLGFALELPADDVGSGLSAST